MYYLKRILRQILPTSEFARNVSVVAGSNALAQALAVLAAPILTRLYAPEDFGILGVYMSLTAIISVVICCRYNVVIPLPSSSDVALKVVYLALICTIVISCFVLTAVWLLADQLALRLGLDAYVSVLYLVPLSSLLLGVFSVLEFWSVRTKRFRQVGAARVHQVGSSLIAQMLTFSAGPIGLVFGQLVSQIVGCWRLYRPIVEDGFSIRRRPHGLIQTASRYRRFPLLSTWSALFNRVSAQLPTLMFAVMFGPAVAGFYALSMRVINGPSVALSNALGSVFISSAAGALKSRTLSNLTVKTHEKICSMVMPAFLFLSVICPDLFVIVFGEQWFDSGLYAQWIVLVVYFSVSVTPLMVLFSVLEKQQTELLYQVGLFLMRCVALYCGWHFGSAYYGVVFFCVVGVVFNLLFLGWVSGVIGANRRSFGLPIARSLLISVLISLPAIYGVSSSDGMSKFYLVFVSAVLLLLYSLKSYRMHLA